MLNRIMMTTLLLQNAREIRMSSWKVWLRLERALVEFHRLVNAILLSFDIRKIVERISVFWMQLQSLLVAAFSFRDQKTVFKGVCKIAVCVGEVWLKYIRMGLSFLPVGT